MISLSLAGRILISRTVVLLGSDKRHSPENRFSSWRLPIGLHVHPDKRLALGLAAGTCEGFSPHRFGTHNPGASLSAELSLMTLYGRID